MKTKELDYVLDPGAMPHEPVELRGQSRDSGRMIVLDRSAAKVEHQMFSNICDFFQPGDLLVLNNSYLLPNSLWFQHGAEFTELVIYGHEPDGTTIIKTKSDQLSVQPGLILTATNDNELGCTILEPQPDQLWKAKFEPLPLLVPALDKYGQRANEGIPIDPALLSTTPQSYRAVFAKVPGSLQIPSAGLHFSTELLTQATAKGVEMAYITLHVGATEIFLARHINEEEIENHSVRSEYFEVGAEAASQINQARAEGRRVIAIGTTVMRTLETFAINQDGNVVLTARDGWTDLYIYPGFKFGVVDAMLTNLHAPRSTHLVLTAAFAGKELLMRGYEGIVKHGGYKFDMFGDSMLIV